MGFYIVDTCSAEYSPLNHSPLGQQLMARNCNSASLALLEDTSRHQGQEPVNCIIGLKRIV